MTERRYILVGCAHAHTADHVRVAAEEGWRCAAVVEPQDGLRTRWAETLGAAAAVGFDTLAEQAEAAIVCGETMDRAREVGGALGLGLPTFSEKPLGPDGATASALARIAERSGLLLDVGFFMRTNPALSGLRDQIRSGALGQIVEARARFAHDGAFADWLDLSGWMTTPARASYGGFGDEGVHVLDWLLWTLGPARDARATLGAALGYRLDDHGGAALRFGDGATGVVTAGWTDREMRLEIDIVGSDGSACLEDGRAVVRRRGEAGPVWSHPLSPLDAGEGLRPFLAAVAEGRRDGLVPPRDAVAVNMLLDRLYGR